MSAGAFAEAACKFIDKTPTPFHLCAEGGVILRQAGFSEVRETDQWRTILKPGGSYYYTRNGSTLVAFTVGADFRPGNGFNIIGAHTDSPVLKLKPCSKKSAHGYLQLNVETYGGGLWHTWFDRELTLAGAVIIKEADGSYTKRLVHVHRPLMRVPSLCIHLQSADERTKFAPNKETHMMPIIAMVSDALNKSADEAGAPAEGGALDERHAPELLRLLGAELSCAPSAIMDFELSLCDSQPAQIWGLHNEFLSSPRLDNQIHCFTALQALAAHAKSSTAAQPTVCMIALFDHEEVGSESACGAGSTVMAEALQRVSSCFAPDEPHASAEALLTTTRRSFLISADVAHAVHPNWAEKHQSSHAPKLNEGTVIKTNDNQRYATNAETGFVFRELARQAGVGVQEFMVKNDCPCGTTIGPIIAAKTGLRTVDVGVPSLSMHSCRETVGVSDVTNSFQLFSTFFKNFAALDGKCDFACQPCAQ
eukprot:CAMPEP_0115840546 /NCGR_PEP_ID=MMETSP0287-20121206/6827_1 /TAXON_ID=412157 /ORGANISM="Chrysochromulina rotalis, Strain UIO044" /LENGTH=478 /DNA_ID=CAMNT_0003294161 /DNA_START=15 /DNA_END=1451 /DNA_ORIENTATION=+